MADLRIAHQIVHGAAQADPADLLVASLLVHGARSEATANLTVAQALVFTCSPVRADEHIAQVIVFTATHITPDPCEAPTPGEDISTALGPLLWLNYDFGAGLAGVGEVLLDDPADYYGGRKLPRLLAASDVRRALSGPRGDYEVGRWSARVADHDRSLHALLATEPGRYWPMREGWLRMVSDVGRRNQVVPYLMAWGLLDGDPRLTDKFEIDLPFRDAIGSSEAWSVETLIPRRTVNTTEFPNARAEVREMAVPFPYGRVTDERSSTPAPTLTINTDKDRGGTHVGDEWTCGWGDMTSGPAPPAIGTVVLSEVDDAAAHMGRNSNNALIYFVRITSVDSDGHEGDTVPFNMDDTGLLTITLSSEQHRLHVEWDAVAGAALYRVYCGWYWYGVTAEQYIETASTSCEFTKQTDWADIYEVPCVPPERSQGQWYTSDITPGAHFPTNGGGGWYAVAAVMADGETALSVSSWGTSKPYVRKVRLEWLAVTGAAGYIVYRTGLWGPFIRRWNVPAGQLWFDDDWRDTGAEVIDGVAEAEGIITPIYVGDTELTTDPGQTWRELLVAGCAISDIRHWYYSTGSPATPEVDQGEGVDFLVPGHAGWISRFGSTTYRDITGSDGVVRRRTVIYARGPKGDAIAAGEATFRVNVDGIEDVGTGNGALITDFYQQVVHFLDNLLLQDYTNGNWQDVPMFPNTSICQVHRPSFNALSLQRQAEIAGGYQGAWVAGGNGERITAQAWLARLCISGQMRIGPNRYWQLKAWALDANADTSEWRRLEDVSEVHGPSGDPIYHRDHLANVLPYRYGPDFTGQGSWLAEATLRDEPSIAGYRREYVAEALEFYCLRSGVLAEHAAQQALLYSRLVPVTIETETDLRGTLWDLGDGLRYTHARGLGGAGSPLAATGYTDRPFVVIGHTFVPGARRVRLECLDVGDMLGGSP